MDTENNYGTLKMQQYLLPILVDIDKMCRENGINYSISDGTLLGAVRHKGYIPWDNDIDISFDRKNFKKFLEVAQTKLPKQYVIVYDTWIRRISRKDNPCINSFPPEGCIDILVFDTVPNDPHKEKKQVLLLKLLQGMLKKKVIYSGFSFKYKVLLFLSNALGKLFPRSVKQKWYDRVSEWGNSEEPVRVARFNGSFKGITNARYPASILDGYEDLDFEGYHFQSITGWKTFLTIMYGDYMTPPAENKRVTVHDHVGERK